MILDVQIKQRFGTFELDAEFSAGAATITAIFGKSGSGKTSLINAVAGLGQPDSGTIQIGGKTLYNRDKGINLLPHQRHIGYIFQDDRLFPHLTVQKNLFYGANRAQKTNQELNPGQILELLGITHLLDRKPHSLSGGEKQRVAIGRALLSNPRLLLMDEPLAALDVPRRQEILSFIEKIRDEFGITVLYVSHAIEEVDPATTTDRIKAIIILPKYFLVYSLYNLFTIVMTSFNFIRFQ